MLRALSKGELRRAIRQVIEESKREQGAADARLASAEQQEGDSSEDDDDDDDGRNRLPSMRETERLQAQAKRLLESYESPLDLLEPENAGHGKMNAEDIAASVQPIPSEAGTGAAEQPVLSTEAREVHDTLDKLQRQIDEVLAGGSQGGHNDVDTAESGRKGIRGVGTGAAATAGGRTDLGVADRGHEYTAALELARRTLASDDRRADDTDALERGATAAPRLEAAAAAGVVGAGGGLIPSIPSTVEADDLRARDRTGVLSGAFDDDRDEELDG